ncbi:hypothetical protein BKA70DRAFT_171516 [Coprinopsis sp. MPI-PUGE-AT-0042]|nr:hypothetical protein BKA70DRAFT_171516 [Coprinopsis sp. MPI-PUGE-AT-0042]
MSDPRLYFLDSTTGAAFVGMVVAAALHGVSCVQAWYYYTHQTDKWPTKLLVASVMIFDTVHQALITHTVYTYSITYWGSPAQLNNLVWSLLVEVLFNGFTAVLVQSFLTHRVYLLSNRNYFLTGVLVLLVAAEFVCVIVFTAISLQLETFTNLANLETLSVTVNALAAAGDVLIAASLCTILHKSRTGFRKSDTMINKLIIFSVNTGFLTSLCAVASLISITVAGHSFLYIAFFFCIGRLYTNSLLATLNARKKIRGSENGINSTTDQFTLSARDTHKVGNGGVTSRRQQHPANISINIHTTKELMTDGDQEDVEKARDLSAHSSNDITMRDFSIDDSKGGRVAPM